MKATVTSKGQVTIPLAIRERLGIQPGQVLEFDETAPLLKAAKVVNEKAMRKVLGSARQQLAGKSTLEWIEEVRGPAELPAAKGHR
jgi:AbrB family looped-hinge helix DNA binding protein